MSVKRRKTRKMPRRRRYNQITVSLLCQNPRKQEEEEEGLIDVEKERRAIGRMILPNYPQKKNTDPLFLVIP